MSARPTFPCPNCGAELVYEPGTTRMTCPYCGTHVDIAATQTVVEERSYLEFLRPDAGRLAPLAEGALEVACGRCGATVEFVPPEVAGACAFCGAEIVAQPKAADPMVAPEGLLPFAFAPERASAEIRTWIASRWFAPSALKKLARPEAVGGVYLPFWTYDAHTDSDYRGERGDYYYVDELVTETDSSGRQVQRTRRVRHTRWSFATGRVERDFDDVLIPAARNLSRAYLDRLDPWDLDALTPYEPAYLSGFKAQRYQVDLPEGFEAAKQVMAGTIHDDVRRDIGGDEQRVHDVDTRYSAVTFKHLLLPVYLGAYRFKEKTYQVMVNARTGEVTGDRPYSALKIALLVLAILAVLLTIYALASK